jgi:hypothetical protein
MNYKLNKTETNTEKIGNLRTGVLFFYEHADEEDEIMMVTDELAFNDTSRRCVSLRNGYIVMFSVEAEVRTVKLVSPPVFELN